MMLLENSGERIIFSKTDVKSNSNMGKKNFLTPTSQHTHKKVPNGSYISMRKVKNFRGKKKPQQNIFVTLQ